MIVRPMRAEQSRFHSGNPKVKIELNDVNSGSPFKQWNKGVALARGAYVWIAESDDYAASEFLEPSFSNLSLFQNFNSSIADRGVSMRRPVGRFCGCQFLPASRSLDGGRPISVLTDRKSVATHLVRGCVIQNASAVLFRKTAYERVGGADEKSGLCGDWKLWASLVLLVAFGYVAEPSQLLSFSSSQRSKQC